MGLAGAFGGEEGYGGSRAVVRECVRGRSGSPEVDEVPER
jgi:hypothetical protein